ncbi:snRNA-activating protein complex subunit 2 [Centroberyx affinis]|uniref:snRNA-activating protein complex subunit 2 n=1 Tax=Centroberyx affinis TaxID=166261 RepID=UPI003A5C21FF
MKPPPRKRSKPERYLKPELILQHPRQRVCTWQRHEQQKLLAALRKLYKTAGSKDDIDYAFLKKLVPNRSVSEIHSVVEALKTKVITSVKHQLMRQRREEQRLKKPIELWTDMASVVTGKLEEPISIAFSQMLIVSSSEPRSLRNSVPLQVHRPTADQQKPAGRTVPRPAAQGELPPSSTSNAAPRLLILKTPTPAIGPARQLPASSQVVRVPTATISPPRQQSFTPVPGTSLAATSTSQSVATSRQSGTTETVVAPAVSPPRSAAQAVTPVSSNQAVDATQLPQPLKLTPVSSATAFVKVMSFGTPIIQTTSQTTEPLKVVGSLTATTTQPQPEAHTTTVASLSSGLPSIGTDRPQPQQPPADISTVSSQPPSHTATPTPASPRVSPQQSSTTASATCLKLSSSIPSSSSCIPANLSSVSSTSPAVLHSSNSSSPTASTPVAALHARSGQTRDDARKDNPRKFGVKAIVDFEKIYRYLSVVHKENEECVLTPMESAIVLDLLMSLPEELPLLDCNKLHSHMIQVYSCLSAPDNSKMAREMLNDEKPEKEGKDQHHITALHNRDSLQTQTGSGQVSGPDPDPAGGGADSRVAMESARKTDKPGDVQAESNNTSRKPGDWEKVGLCPLNPFMVPLKLLMRKQKITDWR